MYVRLLTGRYKGEIREASPDAARVMLGDGRAERAYPEVDGPAPQNEPAAAAVEQKAAKPENVSAQARGKKGR